jgi:hypothetical protein
MKVWHGGYTAIDEIDLSRCRDHCDFGRGFYVTKFQHHAETWAGIVGKAHGTAGCVTEFEYIDSSFNHSICKVMRFDDYSEEWLDFVVMNRDKRNPEPTHDYDIVEGPVADDKVQHKIKHYLRGDISKSDFLEDLKHHEQTHQICFCTLNALQTLDKVAGRDELEWHITDIGEPLIEKLMLDDGIDEVTASERFFLSETFARLADESTGLHLRPWEEIYDLLRKELKI